MMIPDERMKSDTCLLKEALPEDEVSMKSQTDDEKTQSLVQPNTDEDTKAYSEEDSPLPSQSFKNQVSEEEEKKMALEEEKKQTEEYQSIIT